LLRQEAAEGVEEVGMGMNHRSLEEKPDSPKPQSIPKEVSPTRLASASRLPVRAFYSEVVKRSGTVSKVANPSFNHLSGWTMTVSAIQ